MIDNNINNNINKVLVIVIILCSIGFYDINGLGNMVKGLQLLGAVLIIIVLLLYWVYGDKQQTHVKKNFNIFIIVLLLTLIPSMINAAYFHNQSLVRSLYEQRDVYYYLSYFLLHQMRLEKKFLEKLILYFGITYLLFYIIQFLVYPTVLFDVSMMKDRNTLRINLPGVTFAFLSYFYCLQHFYHKKKIKYVIIMILTLVVAILLGGRQVVFMLFFVTILFLLINRHVKYKPAILILAISGLISIYLSFEEVFNAFIQTTVQTREEGSEYIRVRAARYFLVNFSPNKWTFIFGNGNPSGTSSYGRTVERLMDEQGYFISDIGMIGVYVYYGIFFVLGSIALLIKALTLKIKEQSKYIKYYLIMVLQAILTGTGFMRSEFIVVYCIMLYILDISHKPKTEKQPEHAIGLH